MGIHTGWEDRADRIGRSGRELDTNTPVPHKDRLSLKATEEITPVALYTRATVAHAPLGTGGTNKEKPPGGTLALLEEQRARLPPTLGRYPSRGRTPVDAAADRTRGRGAVGGANSYSRDHAENTLHDHNSTKVWLRAEGVGPGVRRCALRGATVILAH